MGRSSLLHLTSPLSEKNLYLKNKGSMTQFTGFWWWRNNLCQLLGIFPVTHIWNYLGNEITTARKLCPCHHHHYYYHHLPSYCYDCDYNHYHHYKNRIKGRITFRNKGWRTDPSINTGIYFKLISTYIRLWHFQGTKWCYVSLNVFPNQLSDFMSYKKRGTNTYYNLFILMKAILHH